MDDKKTQKLIGVRFRPTGKVYHFDPGELQLKPEDEVVVETSRGPEFGYVATPVRELTAGMAPEELKPVLRVATAADRARREENRALERRAADVWEEKISRHKLEMVLVDVEYAFDQSKLLFYFTADGRIDFREFVKELAGVFKTRIELRQIGVRDEAKKVGGLGICGRPFCCASFLPDFEQVSIKMAKEQNLSLNSAKISGTCGRLMCCLRYENDLYQAESKLTPRVGSVVDTENGHGIVTESNVLAGLVRVRLDEEPEKAPQLYRREEETLIAKKRPRNPASNGMPAGNRPRVAPEKATEATEAGIKENGSVAKPTADIASNAKDPAVNSGNGRSGSGRNARRRRPKPYAAPKVGNEVPTKPAQSESADK